MTFPSKASINSYGDGILVDQFTVVNPQSELSASNINNFRNDCAAMTTTAPILHFQFDGYGGSTAPVVVSSATWTTGWDSGWGNNNLYVPTLTRTGTGQLTVQLPASVPDQIGSPFNLVNVRYARACVCGGTTPADFICTVTSSSTFTIQIFVSGSHNDLANTLITVEVF